MECFSKEDLIKIRIEKLKREINSARRLIKSQVEPLEIANNFLHDIYEFVELGVLRRNPDVPKDKLAEIIRENIIFNKNLKNSRKRRENIV